MSYVSRQLRSFMRLYIYLHFPLLLLHFCIERQWRSRGGWGEYDPELIYIITTGSHSIELRSLHIWNSFLPLLLMQRWNLQSLLIFCRMYFTANTFRIISWAFSRATTRQWFWFFFFGLYMAMLLLLWFYVGGPSNVDLITFNAHLGGIAICKQKLQNTITIIQQKNRHSVRKIIK